MRFPIRIDSHNGEEYIGDMNAGKCPKCEKELGRVTLRKVDVSVDFQPTLKTVSYQCPNCLTILGVGVDPVALKEELIDTVKKIVALR